MAAHQRWLFDHQSRWLLGAYHPRVFQHDPGGVSKETKSCQTDDSQIQSLTFSFLIRLACIWMGEYVTHVCYAPGPSRGSCFPIKEGGCHSHRLEIGGTLAARGNKSVQRGLGAITLLREVCLICYLPRLAWSQGPSSLTPSKPSHVWTSADSRGTLPRPVEDQKTEHHINFRTPPPAQPLSTRGGGGL